MEDQPRVIATRSKGLGNDAGWCTERGAMASSFSSADLDPSYTKMPAGYQGLDLPVLNDAKFCMPSLMSGSGPVPDRHQINFPIALDGSNSTYESTATRRPTGAFKPVVSSRDRSQGFRPFVSQALVKEEDQVAAAAVALTSLSSNGTDSTHLAMLSPPPDLSKELGIHSQLAVDKDVSPEVKAASLQPTPSPYQDSNADPEAGQMLKDRHGGPSQKSSNFRGVSWHKHSQKWYAYIQHTGKMHGLGYFHDEREAAAAFDKEARKVHGAKANLNFPLTEHGDCSRASSLQPSLSLVKRARNEQRGDSQQIMCDLDSMSLASPFEREAQLRNTSVSLDIVDGCNKLETANSVQSPSKPQESPGPTAKGAQASKHIEPGRPRRRASAARAAAVQELQSSSDSGDSSHGIVEDSWAQDAEEDSSPTAGHARPPVYGSRRKGCPVKSDASQRSLKSGSSQYKGVSWSERSKKWRAQMWYGNKVHHLGFFDDEKEAARIYDAAVVKLRGPSCHTNFDPRQVASHEPLKEGLVESMTNSSLPRVKSKFRGVRWHYCNRKWEARIFDGARQISLGYFDSQEDAAEAYDRQARNLRGSVAIVNFPAKPQKVTTCTTRASGRSQGEPQGAKPEEDLMPPLLARWGSKRRRVGA